MASSRHSRTISEEIMSVDSEKEILSAIAHATWHNANEGAECPEDMIPTSERLAEWFEAGTLLKDDMEAMDRSARALTSLFDADESSWVVDHGYLKAVMLPRREDFQSSRLAAQVASIEEVHQAWLIRGGNPHPLAPIVGAWQMRPLEIIPNDRDSRIMPSRLGMVNPGDNRALPRSGRLSLFSPAAHVDSEQMALPGFGMSRDSDLPALPLALYELGMRGMPSRGPAPLALRLWVESILSTGLDERLINRPLAMQVSLRNMRERLWPNSWRGYNTDRLRRVLHEAADALDSWDAAWPWYDPETGRGGSRRIVMVTDIGNSLNDTLRLVVDLPPGAAEGPQVTPTLGEWGARSADAYRTLLNLAYHWHKPGQTHMPIAEGRHWIRRYTPDAYPEMSDDDLLALVFPTSVSSTTRSDRLYRARRTIQELEEAGELRRIGNRILPPEGTP